MAQAQDEVGEAIGAYWRYHRRQGLADCQIAQPSRYSDVRGDRVILTNSRGYLATYHLSSRRIAISQRERRRVERERQS